jgi:hypothetical protein
MKKMSFCFLVLFASFMLAIQSFGQSSQSDSLKMDLNLSSEVVKKLDNKDIVEIIKYREKLALEKEMEKAKMNLPNMTSESTATIWSILIGIFILSLFAIPYYFVLTPQIAGHNLKNKLGLIKFGNYGKNETEIYT